MAIVGYARVSSVGQSLEVQKGKLEAADVDKLFEEKKSGVDSNRPALKQCIEYLREGDTMVISRIDRLARSAEDLLRIVRELEDKGVTLSVLDQSIDTRDAAGKAFLGMLAVFAEFETNIRKERQMEGIAKAKAEGKVFGRKPLSEGTKQEILRLRADGVSFNKIAKALNISVGAAHKIAKAE